MRLEVQCPLCGHMMEAQEDTEWSLRGQRSVIMLCPNCTHTEELTFTVEKKPSGTRDTM